ncbi:MAG: response regulator, partial [Rhizobium pusense]|nr:response regulator [Agrobacterium pusense]
MRILLLEDEPEMARALLEALRRRDVLADHVSTISDADVLARDGSYDVLVLDRRLPDGEGLNLVSALRRSKHSVPILVLTALGSVDHRVDG